MASHDKCTRNDFVLVRIWRATGASTRVIALLMLGLCAVMAARMLSLSLQARFAVTVENCMFDRTESPIWDTRAGQRAFQFAFKVHGNGGLKDLLDGKEKAYPTVISFEGVAEDPFRADDIRRLSRVAKIERAIIRGPVSDEAVNACADFDALELIVIVNANISDEALRNFEAAHRLTEIRLVDCQKLTNQLFRVAKNISSLRLLLIYGNPQPDSAEGNRLYFELLRANPELLVKVVPLG